MFCCTLLYVHSNFAIIVMGKREMVAFLGLSSWCRVIVVWLFLAVPWVCLRFAIVIVVIPDHTHLLVLQPEPIIKAKLKYEVRSYIGKSNVRAAEHCIQTFNKFDPLPHNQGCQYLCVLCLHLTIDCFKSVSPPPPAPHPPHYHDYVQIKYACILTNKTFFEITVGYDESI